MWKRNHASIQIFTCLYLNMCFSWVMWRWIFRNCLQIWKVAVKKGPEQESKHSLDQHEFSSVGGAHYQFCDIVRETHCSTVSNSQLKPFNQLWWALVTLCWSGSGNFVKHGFKLNCSVSILILHRLNQGTLLHIPATIHKAYCINCSSWGHKGRVWVLNWYVCSLKVSSTSNILNRTCKSTKKKHWKETPDWNNILRPWFLFTHRSHFPVRQKFLLQIHCTSLLLASVCFMFIHLIKCWKKSPISCHLLKQFASTWQKKSQLFLQIKIRPQNLPHRTTKNNYYITFSQYQVPSTLPAILIRHALVCFIMLQWRLGERMKERDKQLDRTMCGKTLKINKVILRNDRPHI